METATIIQQTKNWIENVVIGCNFCPFAAREFKSNRIHYKVSEHHEIADILMDVMDESLRLDNDSSIETSFLILPQGFNDFHEYLHLVNLAEKLLKKQGYEGEYQLASFHPEYTFADSEVDDPANFTNRSPYPMLHFLREESLEKALEKYPDPESIPINNIRFAREKGLEYMRSLLKKA